MENLVGNLVESRKGRDYGKIYLVYANDNENVFLVDGDSRKISNPKKKNIKHILNLNCVNDKIKDKIIANSKVFDSEIYSCLKKFKNRIEILK